MDITSVSNPKIKFLQDLREKKHRREHGLIVVEGAREISRALSSGYKAKEIYFCEPLVSEEAAKILKNSSKARSFSVSEKVFAKVAVRDNSDGIMVVFPFADMTLDTLKLSAKPLVLVVEGLEKPGNLGALFRTADGAGVEAVLVIDEHADAFHPHAIRASLGTVFTIPLVKTSNEDLKAFFKKHEIKSFVATPEAREVYSSQNLSQNVAVILGSEAFGVSDFWKKHADHQVKIPMLGKADSLNVSVAGAILCYEIVRQRSGGGK
jgi:TrmH family RNA methyltransferase